MKKWLSTLLFLWSGIMASEEASFAGGCFWCMQHDFDSTKGVISTTVGYTGGEKSNPSYQEVCTGKTGHVEAIRVIYDPSLVTYAELLNVYWDAIDPTRDDGQFCDTGPQYRPVIFYHNDTQKKLAEESKQELAKKYKHRPILVAIEPAKKFYPAEDTHQEYYKKNPVHYNLYRYSCRPKKT